MSWRRTRDTKSLFTYFFNREGLNSIHWINLLDSRTGVHRCNNKPTLLRDLVHTLPRRSALAFRFPPRYKPILNVIYAHKIKVFPLPIFMKKHFVQISYTASYPNVKIIVYCSDMYWAMHTSSCRMMLKVSLRWRTTNIMSSGSTILLKLGNEAPLNGLSNLSLSLRSGPWNFEFNWGVCIYEGWSQGVWGHWLGQAVSSNKLTRNYEVSFLLWEDLKEKKRSLALHISLLDSFKLSLGPRASPSVLLDVGDDNSDDRPTIEWEVFSSYIFVCHSALFVNFSFPWSKYIVWEHPPHFNITFVGKPLSTFVIWELKTT